MHVAIKAFHPAHVGDHFGVELQIDDTWPPVGGVGFRERITFDAEADADTDAADSDAVQPRQQAGSKVNRQ